MYPHLFELPFLRTYGLSVMVGILVGLRIVGLLSKRSKIDPEKTYYLSHVALFAGLLGARILWAIVDYQWILEEPIRLFQFWKGGIVFYGGPLLAIPVLIFSIKKFHLPVWGVLDVMAPALAVGHAFGRIGCFLGGCCYGRPTDSFLGVRLDHALSSGYGKVHPTQLYESAFLFLLHFFLMRLFRRKTFDGQVCLTYLFSYPIARFCLEFFRGDSERGFVVGSVSTSQFISSLLLVVTAVALKLRINELESTREGRRALQKFKRAAQKFKKAAFWS